MRPEEEPTTATIYIKPTATNSLDWLSQNSQTDGSQSLKTHLLCATVPRTRSFNIKTSFGNKQQFKKRKEPFKGRTLVFYKTTVLVFTKKVVRGHS